MKRYFINLFMAGSNAQGSTHSSMITTLYYDNQIDFKELRALLKKGVLDAIESGIPCVKDTKVYFNGILIDYQKAEDIRLSKGTCKLTNILKWKDK